jgi:hypothetical protein
LLTGEEVAHGVVSQRVYLRDIKPRNTGGGEIACGSGIGFGSRRHALERARIDRSGQQFGERRFKPRVVVQFSGRQVPGSTAKEKAACCLRLCRNEFHC